MKRKLFEVYAWITILAYGAIVCIAILGTLFLAFSGGLSDYIG